jgi:subtilisin family serine protease
MHKGIRISAAAAGLTMLIGASGVPTAEAADRLSERANAQLPASISGLRLAEPLTIQADRSVIDPALVNGDGPQQVLVRLRSPSVAKHVKQSKGNGAAHKQRLISEQSAFVKRASKMAPGAKKVADVQVALNAVVMEVDAAAIDELAKDPDVYRISRVKDYELDLSETVPYIGAAIVQAAGVDGSGVSVAVLDSGIDYTHADLGGPGTFPDYLDAWGTSLGDPKQTTRDGLFPTAKVVEGYDFVGELWPLFGPLLPDEDPIDLEGHGTHVADIIGGNLGVAPGVDLYAVKVCSAVSSSCSGVALIQGMEFSVDPNGDGDPSDAVDIINMSLGAGYGQPFDDDLSQAVENASALGVLTVSSAGNCGDLPYCTGTPSSAPSALSVAQTQVPSAALQLITVDGVGDIPAVFQAWSVPLAGTISGPVQYADGAGGNLNGCAPFAPGSLTGLIVLVDRGACNFTLKISNISQAGGAAGIIGLVAPGAPFSGGDGGDRPIDIPGYMINQADSNAIKAAVPAPGTIDPANQLLLAGQMVGSSARGPQHEAENLIKPEIGAPGASVSAQATTGTGRTPFGGTSGASPMVAGSAALLLEAQPGLTPAEAKAKLMNTGDTNIDIDPFSGLAEITRIGGGEVRADRAVGAPAAAWDEDTLQGGLSFGFVDADKSVQNLHKKVRVRNYSDKAITFSITPTFRYADDAASGAVSVDAPQKVKVRANSDQVFNVKMTINGLNLPGNFMSSGSQGANPAALTANEFDGYLRLEGSDGSSLHLPWHVLPRQSANVVGRSVLTFSGGVDNVSLTNNGVGTAQIDAYSLLAVSPNMPEGPAGGQAPMPDLRAVGVNTFPVPAGFCSGQDSFIWAFAINTWERQEHLLPVSHQVWLDTDRDGSSDYVVLNRDLSGLGTISDGRQVAWALNLATGSASAFFFAEHATNTGNTVLLICGEQIGLTGTDMLSTNVDAFVVAQDFYYGGGDDLVDGLTITPLGERYFGIPSDIPASGVGTTTVVDFGAFPGNTDELGLMLITNGDRGTGARGGATQATEALLLEAK